jgi:protein tyrosine phosphatase (PTP) superfamily phosphohydrolase (DUF442 family)
MRPSLSLLALSALALAACASRAALRPMAAPLALTSSAYEAAGALPLPKQEARELPGLHHVYALSDDIISGAEPEGEQAFVELQKLGIKTVLSVDGKAPDAATAAKYGLRYVHVPIRYSGITEEERVAIAKSFRELEGPFYVHCFHGQHRGPAAAALGRVVLDGAGRDQAIAEMRQYCGTSQKYEGLYQDIASGNLPDESVTRASRFDFAPVFRFSGVRALMVEMTRSYDTLVDLSKRNWQASAEHPDATAQGEAQRLYQALSQAHSLPETALRPDDYRQWMARSVEQSTALLELLKGPATQAAASSAQAVELVGQIGKTCEACHAAYRNN